MIDLEKQQKFIEKYIPSADVRKEIEEKGHIFSDWDQATITTDVITCAAPKLLSRLDSSDHRRAYLTDKELFNLQEDRISRILDAGIRGNREVMILGAFGCGAFNNKASVVAEAFKEVLKDYRHAFRIVEFAIYCKEEDTANYQIFSNKLGRH